MCVSIHNHCFWRILWFAGFCAPARHCGPPFWRSCFTIHCVGRTGPFLLQESLHDSLRGDHPVAALSARNTFLPVDIGHVWCITTAMYGGMEIILAIGFPETGKTSHVTVMLCLMDRWIFFALAAESTSALRVCCKAFTLQKICSWFASSIHVLLQVVSKLPS